MSSTPSLRGVSRGTVPAKHLVEFTRFAESSGVTLLTCDIKRPNLEETFVNVLKGGAAP